MAAFHPLKVRSVDRVAEDAACVTVEIPASLKDAFAFHAGQYVSVRRTIGEREERRTYSIVTPPGGVSLKLGIRMQTGGLMSGELTTKLRAGDMLEVAPPMGRFRTAVDPARAHSYVAFAAGSGITPVLSLATDILAREPGSGFTLIYGNRSMARTMFLEDILALKNRYVDRFSVHFVMSREPQQTAWLNGRIDAAKIAELAAHMVEIAAADEYLICGPGDMVDAVRTALKEINGNAAIRFERFASGVPGVAGAAAAGGRAEAAELGARAGAAGRSSRGEASLTERPGPAVAADEPVLASITVVMDGRRRSFAMSRNDASVLEAAERAGLDLPFSCRAGICATCRARITRGAATMTHNIALEPWETEAGFVLCCQARPTTDTLELSYDHK
ncbi:MAG TPA: 2Fe-2S iron-sulfur cluster-binding protein [Steroidobacteraceae bacterium]|nr:2Fe-2S iron-sulfur cluster-binding protein [Steroidobacteraceae bacterium]